VSTTSANVIPITHVGPPTRIGTSSIRQSMVHSRLRCHQVLFATRHLATQPVCTMRRSVQTLRQIGPTSNGCKCFEELGGLQELIVGTEPIILLQTSGRSLQIILVCQPPTHLNHAHAASTDNMSSWQRQRITSKLVSTLHVNATCV
jgi:hypothetical protein